MTVTRALLVLLAVAGPDRSDPSRRPDRHGRLVQRANVAAHDAERQIGAHPLRGWLERRPGVVVKHLSVPHYILRRRALNEQLAPFLLAHEARRNALALEQRPTAGSPDLGWLWHDR
jgi:hypothetical protein